jgi:hypothetical protein
VSDLWHNHVHADEQRLTIPTPHPTVSIRHAVFDCVATHPYSITPFQTSQKAVPLTAVSGSAIAVGPVLTAFENEGRYRERVVTSQPSSVMMTVCSF